MAQDTQTKAATVATLIAAGKDSMANDVISDIMSPLSSEEIDAVIGALSERSDGAEELDLYMLAPYGLPYVPDIDEDDYSREGTVDLIDRALVFFRLDMDNVAMQTEHTSPAVMRPYSGNLDKWHVVDLFMEIGNDVTFGIEESGTAIHGAIFSIHYECSPPDVWETYVHCRLDVIVGQDGRVQRLGEMREVASNWYAD